MAEFNVWLLIVGIAAGAAVTWLVVGNLSRSEDEIAPAEQASEAAWIARLIEEHGGRVPVALVEQILELHRRYLKGGPDIPLPGETPSEEAPMERFPGDEALSERPSRARSPSHSEPTPDAVSGRPDERAGTAAR